MMRRKKNVKIDGDLVDEWKIEFPNCTYSDVIRSNYIFWKKAVRGFYVKKNRKK